MLTNPCSQYLIEILFMDVIPINSDKQASSKKIIKARFSDKDIFLNSLNYNYSEINFEASKKKSYFYLTEENPVFGKFQLSDDYFVSDHIEVPLINGKAYELNFETGDVVIIQTFLYTTKSSIVSRLGSFACLEVDSLKKKRATMIKNLFKSQEHNKEIADKKDEAFIEYSAKLIFNRDNKLISHQDCDVQFKFLLFLKISVLDARNNSISSVALIKPLNNTADFMKQKRTIFVPTTLEGKEANFEIIQEQGLTKKVLFREDFIIDKAFLSKELLISLDWESENFQFAILLLFAFDRPLDLEKAALEPLPYSLTDSDKEAQKIIKEAPDRFLKLHARKIHFVYSKSINTFSHFILRKALLDCVISEENYLVRMNVMSLRIYSIIRSLKDSVFKGKKESLESTKYVIFKKQSKNTPLMDLSVGGYFDSFTKFLLNKKSRADLLLQPARRLCLEFAELNLSPFFLCLENCFLSSIIDVLILFNNSAQNVFSEETDCSFSSLPLHVKQTLKLYETTLLSYLNQGYSELLFANSILINKVSCDFQILLDPESFSASLSELNGEKLVRLKFLLGLMEKISTDKFSIQLAGFVEEDSLQERSALTSNIYLFYKLEILKSAPQVLGSLGILGNPVGLFTNISKGLSTALTSTRTSRKENNGFLEGFSLGAASMVGYTIAGVGGSIGDFSSSISNLFSELTFDEGYTRERAYNRRKYAQKAPSMGRAFVGALESTAEGLAGLVGQPTNEIKKKGFMGIFSGIGKGVSGLITKPLIGVLDVTSEGFRKFSWSGQKIVKEISKTEKKQEESDSDEDLENGSIY